MVEEVDMSNGTIMEALNSKADIDLNNLSADDKRALIEENKETIIGWMMPDYTNSETIEQDVEYVASNDCWIYGKALSTSSTSGGHVHKVLYIDDAPIDEIRSFYYNQVSIMIPCKKGSKYKFSNSNTGSGSYTLKVFYCKGTN